MEKITSFRELMELLCGEKMGLAIEIASAFFMYVLFSTMMAGVGATFRQVFNIPFTAAVVIASVLTFIALLFDMEGLLAVNGRLAPFLVAGGLLIGFFSLTRHAEPVFAAASRANWFTAAVVYASYNILTAVPVLAALSGLTPNRRTGMVSGLIGGGAMTVLGLSTAYPLLLYYAQIRQTEIPLLAIARNFGNVFEMLYFVLILCAIFTTAVSNGFALIRWMTDRLGAPLLPAKIILAAAGCCTAHIGFSLFVARVYPMFSMIGFLEIVLLFIAWQKSRKKNRTEKLDNMNHS
jgi:uncharacterized membrane protein YkvI